MGREELGKMRRDELGTEVVRICTRMLSQFPGQRSSESVHGCCRSSSGVIPRVAWRAASSCGGAAGGNAPGSVPFLPNKRSPALHDMTLVSVPFRRRPGWQRQVMHAEADPACPM